MRKILLFVASLLLGVGFSTSTFAACDSSSAAYYDWGPNCTQAQAVTSVTTNWLPWQDVSYNAVVCVGVNAVTGEYGGVCSHSQVSVSRSFSPDCFPGEIRDGSGQCVPACPTNAAIPESDPLCAACGPGLMKYEGQCVPDCASRSGQTGNGEYLLCNVPYSEDAQLGVGGCPTAAGFIGGGFQDGGCIVQPDGNFVCQHYADGRVTCTFDYTVTSTKAPMSNETEGTPSTAPGSPKAEQPPPTPQPPETPPKPVDPAPPPPSCGPGYTLSAGTCVSTTAPENNPPKCPIGYIQSGPNSCVSPNMEIKCPGGYILNAANKCESMGDLVDIKKQSTNSCGGVGQPACKTVLVDAQGNPLSIGQCGGAGQPACKYLAVDENGVPVTHCGGVGQPRCGTQLTDGDGNALFFTRDAGADGSAVGAITDAMGQAAQAVTSASTDDVAHGWTLSLASIFPQSAQCSAWVFNVGGGTQTIDPCPTADKIRSIAEFALYVLTAFSLFRILFGARGAVRS